MLNLLRNSLLAVTLLLAVNAGAQSVDSLIIQGKKLINDGCTQWDATVMQKARAQFERLLTDKKREALVRYYLGYCDYRLATFYQQQTNKEMVSKHLEAAITHLEAALFEKEQLQNPLVPDWGKPEVYAWIGVAYLDKNDHANARTALDRALAIAPDYGWVKNYLYPKAVGAEQ